MVNYADILNAMCLYCHSLRGSTVLPTIPCARPWLRVVRESWSCHSSHDLRLSGSCNL